MVQIILALTLLLFIFCSITVSLKKHKALGLIPAAVTLVIGLVFAYLSKTVYVGGGFTDIIYMLAAYMFFFTAFICFLLALYLSKKS